MQVPDHEILELSTARLRVIAEKIARMIMVDCGNVTELEADLCARNIAQCLGILGMRRRSDQG